METTSQETIQSALGRLVMAWNVAEDRVRALLGSFCGSQSRDEIALSLILTVELGGVGMSNALKAVASDILTGDTADAVKHVANLCDALRSYRNYYVHGIVDGLTFTDGQLGVIFSRSAKASYAQHDEHIGLSDLTDITARIEALTLYTNRVLNHLHWEDGDDWQPERPPLPEKPPLPETLKKPRRGLRARQPPLQSSRGSPR